MKQYDNYTVSANVDSFVLSIWCFLSIWLNIMFMPYESVSSRSVVLKAVVTRHGVMSCWYESPTWKAWGTGRAGDDYVLTNKCYHSCVCKKQTRDKQRTHFKWFTPIRIILRHLLFIFIDNFRNNIGLMILDFYVCTDCIEKTWPVHNLHMSVSFFYNICFLLCTCLGYCGQLFFFFFFFQLCQYHRMSFYIFFTRLVKLPAFWNILYCIGYRVSWTVSRCVLFYPLIRINSPNISSFRHLNL